MCEIRLHTALAPINVMTLLEDDAVFTADLGGQWSDMEFEVALDSGAVIRVCSPADLSRLQAGGVAGEQTET